MSENSPENAIFAGVETVDVRWRKRLKNQRPNVKKARRS
jgi:hypothetical protein